MSIQQIRKKQIGHNLSCMGKGSYMDLQNETIKAAEDLLFKTHENRLPVLQMATNSLQ